MSGQPIFWLAMTYACDGCGNEERFLLEEGCEGPRDRHIEAVGKGPFNKGKPVRIPVTASGRAMVPVPFIAGPCPSCNPTGRKRLDEKGWLTHVRWNEDEELDPRPIGIPEGPHFRYPTPREYRRDGDQACGRPVYLRRAVS